MTVNSNFESLTSAMKAKLDPGSRILSSDESIYNSTARNPDQNNISASSPSDTVKKPTDIIPILQDLQDTFQALQDKLQAR